MQATVAEAKIDENCELREMLAIRSVTTIRQGSDGLYRRTMDDGQEIADFVRDNSSTIFFRLSDRLWGSAFAPGFAYVLVDGGLGMDAANEGSFAATER